jgi:hypothetical protein
VPPLTAKFRGGFPPDPVPPIPRVLRFKLEGIVPTPEACKLMLERAGVIVTELSEDVSSTAPSTPLSDVTPPPPPGRYGCPLMLERPVIELTLLREGGVVNEEKDAYRFVELTPIYPKSDVVPVSCKTNLPRAKSPQILLSLLTTVITLLGLPSRF